MSTPRKLTSLHRANSAHIQTSKPSAHAAAAISASNDYSNSNINAHNSETEQQRHNHMGNPRSESENDTQPGTRANYETIILDSSSGNPVDCNQSGPFFNQTFVGAICYRGMEITVATVNDGDVCRNRSASSSYVEVIGTRNKMTLQRLRIPKESHGGHSRDLSIVGLHTNPINGIISVVASNRKVYSFHPVPTSPNANDKLNTGARIGTTFGRYIWIAGKVVNWGEFFHAYSHGNDSTAGTNEKNSSSHAFNANAMVHIGSSMDYKLLIANGDQIAVFDITPPTPDETMPERTPGLDFDGRDCIAEEIQLEESTSTESEASTDFTGEILWTTRVRATITAVTISGDGRSIAYALKGEGINVPYPFGVRTFVRDREDGSNEVSSIDGGKQQKRTRRPPRPPPSGSGAGNKYESPAHKDGSPKSKAGGPGGITPPPIPTSGGRFLFDCGSIDDEEETSTNCNNVDSIKDAARNNMGILYKPGPFLVHSTTVTRLSFRGMGLNHSSIYQEDGLSSYSKTKKNRMGGAENGSKSMKDGNDLLLTCCSSDGSFRVFSQGSWKMLFHWDTPPGSRADWIHGITMANLGDLDPLMMSRLKKNVGASASGTSGNVGSQSHGRNADGSISALASASSSADESFTYNMTQPQKNNVQNKKNNQTRNNAQPSTSGWQSQLLPNSAAGAWISEITFRGPYPALRLSRLSFLKSGGDSWAPAHFDSVGTILPPATILARCVLQNGSSDQHGLVSPNSSNNDDHTRTYNMESMSMSVQGVWSAWNPWIAHPDSGGNVAEDESLSGNAMALLGSVPHGYGGSTSGVGLDMDAAAAFGGTHSPPAELRLVASHVGDKVVIMDFPLWGDADFGAMQLGSPLRYSMSLKECVPEDVKVSVQSNDANTLIEQGVEEDNYVKRCAPLPVTVSTRCACLDFESNSLCAVVTGDKKNISLEWRKKGTMNIISQHQMNESSLGSSFLSRQRSDSDISIGSTVSIHSAESHTSFQNLGDGELKQYYDWSINPLPLSLPSLHLPAISNDDEFISSLKWWPDENFGGPPRLFALTSEGTLILYEMPPPWSALEPITPDPFTLNSIGDTFHSIQSSSDFGSISDRVSHHDLLDDSSNNEDDDYTYTAQLTPHPDFGLGLRLEAQADDMPAIAGSFKKHPLTGGRLPAERTGKIVLGDELISVNGVSLEGMSFDDIISTVRHVSSAAEGGPLTMEFRALQRNRMTRDSLSNHDVSDFSPSQEGLEVVHQKSSDDRDQKSVLVGADAESQQEYGRIVAIMPNALPSYEKSPRSLVLLPWHYGKGAPTPYEVRGAALLVSAVGRRITATRVEVRNGFEPESCGILTPLGSMELDGKSDIASLVYIKTASDGWCVGACDKKGEFQLVFIDVTEGIEASELSAEFRTHVILNSLDEKESTSIDGTQYLVRAQSVELLGAMVVGGQCREVSIWTSAPFVSNLRNGEQRDDEISQNSYQMAKISHRDETGCAPILDFRWIAGGGIDAFPWLVTYSQRSAIVHCRRGNLNMWVPVAELSYPSVKEIFAKQRVTSDLFCHSLTPSDTYPHLMTALRDIVSVTDEKEFLLTDWQPEAMLAFLCSGQGPEIALKTHTEGILNWLAEWMDPKDSMTTHWDARSRLSSAPFDLIYGSQEEEEEKESQDEPLENASALMQNLTVRPKELNENARLKAKLQNCILSEISKRSRDKENSTTANSKVKHSKEFMMAMNSVNIPSTEQLSNSEADEIGLPEPIKELSSDELCFLWSMGEICTKPPAFKGLDHLAQLTVLSMSIIRQVECSSYEDPSPNIPIAHSSPRTFLVKHSSSSNLFDSAPSHEPNKIAPSACLAALLSDSQSLLLSVCKPGYRWTWEAVRSLNLPFWLRSVEELKAISDEIAQNTFKETLDVVESSLFYVITGNMRKLKTVAAADRNSSGRTFLKFITSYDFSSTRGRTAAEKNAFSLLRKRKYGPAAAFFLLAEPPMLEKALNIVVTKMKDFALAFFVARLVEANRSNTNSSTENNFTIGGGFSLRGLGGGGGFASQKADSDPVEKAETLYKDWIPNLAKSTRKLLESDGIPKYSEDPCSQCICMLWLNRPNDAAMCLMGSSYTDFKTQTINSRIEKFSPSFQISQSEKTSQPATARVIAKVNTVLDFATKPVIIRKMNLPQHAQWFASLTTSRALCHRGIELSSLITLPDLIVADKSGKSKNIHLTSQASSILEQPCSSVLQQKAEAASNNFTSSAADQTSSSIFDTYDMAPPVQLKNKPPVPDQMASSIFDSFDTAPPPKPKDKPHVQDPITSSIFDSFDTAPPPKPKTSYHNNSSVATGQMSSSIFDSFDTVPPGRPKTSAQAAAPFASAGQMTSSIFDSFDAPPPRNPKSPVHTQPSTLSGQMESSIFDSFNTAPPSAQTASSAPPEHMASSIFDSFDAAPPCRPKAPSDSIQLASSILPNTSYTTQEKEEEKYADSEIVDVPLPPIWIEWRQNILTTGVARRLLREMARVITPFLGDIDETPMALFRRHVHPLVSYNAAHIFQEVCEGETVLSVLVDILDNMCSEFQVSSAAVVEHALLILGCPRQPQRIVFAVLLHCLTGRADLAEDVIRDAAHDLVQRCETILFANDDLVYNRKTKHHISSQYMRRRAAYLSFQLELCLWLHRGGGFPMSGLALKEATVGVRIGYIVASWGRCHEALENLLSCDPDCSMDFQRGRQLWSSMKMILSLPQEEEKIADSAETTSGGWEFLVDCNREEATTLLRPRSCGSFLLRPNPEDHGIFTLSFRTNQKSNVSKTKETNSSSPSDTLSSQPPTKIRDDAVQHAIVRLSDAGFKCGSFGPFSSLLKLLEAVSTSLPFDLLFSEPPAQGIIKEEGGQPSPNSVFIRKFSLHSKTEHYRWNSSTKKQKKINQSPSNDEGSNIKKTTLMREQSALFQQNEQETEEFERLRQIGSFSQLLVLTELRKQISAVVASTEKKLDERSTWEDSKNKLMSESLLEDSSDGCSEDDMGQLEMDAIASRMIRPFLNWCRTLETSLVGDLLPMLSEISQNPASSMPVALSASATAIEAVPTQIGSNVDCGDAIIRRMIQPRSGVEFRTLRVGEAGHSAVVVLFRRSQAISWILKSRAEMNDVDAAKRLDIMEKRRVIERVDLKSIAYEKQVDSEHNEFIETDNDVRYRFVDPWEVEVLESKDAELRGVSLGREQYVPFTIGAVARACEESQRDLGGLHLLSLWSAARGGVCLTKALASAYPPWERDAGGDLQVVNGVETQPTTYANSFRQHLYRNALFHRLRLPQRFLAFIQVEILDLKNLTAPGGSPSVTAYALLRLKRDASNAPLTHKARTLDSASTEPRKIIKSSGPNAPASWGSVVRFRFPLPEGVNCDGVSFDSDREALFKGAPSVLQISVYEKKFMTNSALGGADVSLDALSTNGQLEEWVPLRSLNDDITWFARLRLTLRFELMCLASLNSTSSGTLNDQCPSAGLRKMKVLSRLGGAHEDANGVTRSISSPDIVTYFENMVS